MAKIILLFMNYASVDDLQKVCRKKTEFILRLKHEAALVPRADIVSIEQITPLKKNVAKVKITIKIHETNQETFPGAFRLYAFKSDGLLYQRKLTSRNNYQGNQILGRLMQPESLGALIAMKRLAKSTTLPNQGTAKLAMFYWHAMMEVKENPNSGWKQSIDDNFKSQFDAIAQARYDPRFMLGRMRLYALCGFTSGDNSPENAAAFYDFVVWFYSFPNNASDLAYFKTIVQSDSSPGQISSFYDMMADMRVKLLPFFGNTGPVWKTGSALAATTPHEYLQAGVFEHLQTPVVQAAIERFREFFGIGNLPMATREDIDAWQQSLMETYQKNVMKMHPSLANL